MIQNQKTILITGANGFIGSHILEKLINDNYNIIITTRTFSNLNRINHLDKKKYISYNLDECSLESVFNNNKIDIIFHFATFYKKYHQYNDIDKMIESNIIFSLKLLELSNIYNVSYFINADTFFKKGLYAHTKKLIRDISKEYKNLKIINTIIHSPFGEKDHEDKIIPYIIKSIISNKVPIIENPNATLYFTHIDEIASQYEKILNAIKLNIIKDNYLEMEIKSYNEYSIKDIILYLNTIHNYTINNIELPSYLKEISIFNGLISTYNHYDKN